MLSTLSISSSSLLQSLAHACYGCHTWGTLALALSGTKAEALPLLENNILGFCSFVVLETFLILYTVTLAPSEVCQWEHFPF